MENMFLPVRSATTQSTEPCEGESLLWRIQMSPFCPHPDSKTFVDLSLRYPPQIVLQNLNNLSSPISEIQYHNFLASNFSTEPDHLHIGPDWSVRSIVIAHVPSDYNSKQPNFISELTQKSSFPLQLSSYLIALKQYWRFLCRTFDPKVRRFSQVRYSTIIPLPHPFFIPGGRFRECYYWDTLWVVKGLLACDMATSAQDAVRNLLFLVHQYGFVPNGSRLYYLSRSQPPVLAECVRLIYNALPEPKQLPWLREALPALDKELTFFHAHRAVSVVLPHSPCTARTLSVYAADTTRPRPESFKEDVSTAAATLSPENKSIIYRNIATAAESGWDFSSRWFATEHLVDTSVDSKTAIASLRTYHIIPVCLNSLLLHAERTVAAFHHALAHADLSRQGNGSETTTSSELLERSGNVGNEPPVSTSNVRTCFPDRKGTDASVRTHMERGNRLLDIAAARERDMVDLLWDRHKAFWFDVDGMQNEKTAVVSCAGLMPIWAECNKENWNAHDATRLVRFLMNESGLLCPGGLAATSNRSGQQWDFPNSWPPLIDFVVGALEKLATAFPECGASEAAAEIARRFVRSTFRGWCRDGVMHEKYDSTSLQGDRGEGGEYEPQTGFGWTNGTVLWLVRYFLQKDENFWNDFNSTPNSP